MSLSRRGIPVLCSLAVLSVSFSLSLSCKRGDGSQKDHPSADSVLIADTIATEVSAEPEDTLKQYYSDDLKSFGIKGEVISRSAMRHDAQMVYPVPTNELTFDDDGVFTGSLEGLYPKTGEDGIIYSYSMNYEDGTSWELTYTDYNEEGYPVRAEIIESGPQGTAQAVITYYGYEYDRMGNWVMRSVTCDRSFVDMDTKEKTNTFRKWKELVSYKYKEKDNNGEVD